MIIGCCPKDQIGLYNVKASEEEVRLMHLFLSESRVVFFEPLKNDVMCQVRYQQNEFTSSLRKLLVHTATDKEPGNYIECIEPGNMYNQGLWRIVENAETDFSDPLKEKERVRIGRQIIRIAKIFRTKTPQSLAKSQTSVGPQQSEPTPPQTTSLKYINYGAQPQSNRNVSDIVSARQISGQNISNSGKNIDIPLCRICFERESDSKPFTPELCKCKNMPVHVHCLRTWMSNKIQQTNFKNMCYYDITQLSCEVCHEHISPMVTVKGQEVFLVSINILNQNDIVVFEVFELSRDKIKGILVVDFSIPGEKNEVILGRSEDCDILFKDVSISRKHAKFVWKNGQLFVFNIESKFGTVRRVDGRCPIAECKNRRFVIDKFLIAFHMTTGKKRCKCVRKAKYKVIMNPIDSNPMLLRIDPPKQIIDENIAQKAMVKKEKPEQDLLPQQPKSAQEVARVQPSPPVRPPPVMQVTSRSNKHLQPPNELPQTIPAPLPPKPNENEPQPKSLRIIDKGNLPDIPNSSMDDMTNSNDLIAQEFAKDPPANTKYPELANRITSSRRLLDILAEQGGKIETIEEEASQEEDLQGETTEQELRRIEAQNIQIIANQNQMYRMNTESSRTISNLYLGSFKAYHFD